jgi:hypothetical protein
MKSRKEYFRVWQKHATARIGIGKAGKKFSACVAIGSKMRGSVKRAISACALGDNPRKAVAAAFRATAKSLEGRSGVFAGLGRASSRRRKR